MRKKGTRKVAEMSNEFLSISELRAKIREHEEFIEEEDRDFIASMFAKMQYDDRYVDTDRIDRSVDGTAPGYSSDFIRESMKKKRGAPES